jgi:hypothetical protein
MKTHGDFNQSHQSLRGLIEVVGEMAKSPAWPSVQQHFAAKFC